MYCAERLDFILNHLDELQHDITIDNQIIEVLRDEKTPETFLLRLFYKILENESNPPPCTMVYRRICQTSTMPTGNPVIHG